MKALMIRSTKTTPVAVLFGFLAFSVLLGWTEYSNWRAEVGRAERSLEQTAEAIAQHADDVIETSRLPLASLISEITDEEGHPHMAQKISALITRQMKASPTLDTLSYIDAEGRMIATSAPRPPADALYTDREYFQFHKAKPFPLPVLGKPIKSRLSGDWVWPISQKVPREDGSFGGVVVSTIRVKHFVNFFRSFPVGSDGSFLIARGDGMVLARGPMAESLLGTNIAAHELFSRYLKAATAGAYHYRSPVDRQLRIGGFYQSDRTGIVVLAAASKRQILVAWMEEARIRWIYAAVLMAVSILAASHWRQQLKRREESEAQLAAREAEFRLLAESSSDVISRFDENGIREYVSPSSAVILGIEPDRLIGKSVYAGMTEEAEATVREAAARLQTGSTHEKFLIKHVKPSGEEVWLETALSKLPEQNKASATRVVAITRDVTTHKVMHDQLDQLAGTDDLTKLANRRSFNVRFEEMMKRARRSRTPLSLLMIDADRFKLLNDVYGHAVGDECLTQIAAVVRSCVKRPGDIAARYGGEEMAVLLTDADVGGAWTVAERIRVQVSALELPHTANLPFGHVTVSIGAATLPPEAPGDITAQALFTQADAALYRAKEAGRNQVVSANRTWYQIAKSAT